MTAESAGTLETTESENPPVRRLADWSAARFRALSAKHGTPLYVLDTDRVRENASRLRRAFPDAEVSYAVKANAIRTVLETVAEEGLGAECASAGEAVRALDAGFSTVRYTAVNPPAADLDRVVALAGDRDITITVDAADTLDRLAERGWSGRLMVRINPGIGAGHHEKVATGADPQFGVPADRAVGVVNDAVKRGFDVAGIHAHAGSGLSNDDLDTHRTLVSRMAELAHDIDVDLDVVNVGGGFGVPSHDSEPPLDLDAVARTTREAFGDCDARLGIEPGRYLVADAGVLLARVNTVKPTPKTTVAGVDAGMTTLLRPALYDAFHEIRVLASDADGRERTAVTVAGPVCESADTFVRDRALPEPTRGDLLAVGTAGAYGYEMASTYNSRPRPAVVALDGDNARLCVRRETIADLTRLER